MKDFKKYFTIPAPPEDIYIALTNPFTIQLWSGEAADMSTEPGSEFSWFEGSIVGKNLSFEPNRQLVQQWYFGEQSAASVVTIKLHPHKQGTSVEVKQTNIPEDDYANIAEGWEENIMAPLRDFYEE